MTKKIFHTILSLLLVFSICAPINVFATEVTDEKSTVESIDSEDAVVLAATPVNDFVYPDDTTVRIDGSITKIKYCAVPLFCSEGTVIIRLKKSDGSEQRSFTLICDGAWYTIDRSSNPIPAGTYNISIVYSNVSNYQVYMNFY